MGRSTYKPKQVFILKKWLSENIEEPFLKKAEKRDIAEKTGLTPKQIQNWVKNTRKVSLLLISIDHSLSTISSILNISA
jgi:hypothetical protein